MARAWRITESRYAGAAFEGEGTRLYGGRWSSPGVSVVYTAEHLSLAILEIIVNLDAPGMLADYVRFAIEIPDEIIHVFPVAELPEVWRDNPWPDVSQEIGDRWIRESAAAVLRLPSAITVVESNYLINPLHPDFGRIRVGASTPLDADRRLFAR